ncbi:MAG: hypothetical protein M1429_03560 [Patescibacteria group bacterium]|nr:hypothetical protein [Patescibacteria group bacterium]
MNGEAWLQNRLTLYIFGSVLTFLAVVGICFSFYNYIIGDGDFGASLGVFIYGLIFIFFTCLISVIVQLILCKREGRSFGDAFVVILAVTITSFLMFFSTWYILTGIIDYLIG